MTGCVWVHDAFGVHLHCNDRNIPGGDLCAYHLIQWAAAQTPEYFLARDRMRPVQR